MPVFVFSNVENYTTVFQFEYIPPSAGMHKFRFDDSAPTSALVSYVQPSWPTPNDVYRPGTRECIKGSSDLVFDFNTIEQTTSDFIFKKPVCGDVFNTQTYNFNPGCYGEPCDDTPQYQGDGTITLDNNTSAGSGAYSDYAGGGATTIDDADSNAFAQFDYTVVRLDMFSSTCSNASNTEAMIHTNCSLVEQAESSQNTVCVVTQDTTAMGGEIYLPSEFMNVDNAESCDKAQTASDLSIEVCFVFNPLTLLSTAHCGGGEDSEPLSVGFCTTNELLEGLGLNVCDVSQNPESAAQQTFKRVLDSNLYTPETDFNMANTYTPSAAFNWITSGKFATTTIYAPLITYKLCEHHLRIIDDWLHSCESIELTEPLPFGQTVWVDPIEPIDPIDPINGDTVTIPTKEVYPVSVGQNSVSVSDSNGSSIAFSNVSLTHSSEANSWQFKGDLLLPAQQALINPKSDGSYVTLTITINGYQWVIVVERLSTTRTFNKKSVSVVGRGLQSTLSDPYVETTSFTQNSILTNQQIAESLLPIGWTINWSLPVWSVPENTYSHNNLAPIAALNRLVSDIGGMLVPDRTLQVINAKPRYPVLPWDFDVAAADFIVPDAAIIQLVEEPVSIYGANGIYIHGSGDTGRQALVRQRGTSGERLARTATNQMMTGPEAIRSLGERLLAAEWSPPEIKGFTTFMDGVQVPLIEVGSLVQVDVGASNHKGVVSKTTIDVKVTNDVPVVQQSLTIAEDQSNYKMLKRLVSPRPVQLGTVVSVDSSTSLISLVGGGSLRVQGVGDTNSNYFIQEDQLGNKAPNLTVISDIVVN